MNIALCWSGAMQCPVEIISSSISSTFEGNNSRRFAYASKGRPRRSPLALLSKSSKQGGLASLVNTARSLKYTVTQNSLQSWGWITANSTHINSSSQSASSVLQNIPAQTCLTDGRIHTYLRVSSCQVVSEALRARATRNFSDVMLSQCDQ